MISTAPASNPQRRVAQRTDAPLVVTGIQKSYGQDGQKAVEIIADISFALAKDEIVSMVGPSGCGKSTLSTCFVALRRFRAAMYCGAVSRSPVCRSEWATCCRRICYCPGAAPCTTYRSAWSCKA